MGKWIVTAAQESSRENIPQSLEELLAAVVKLEPEVTRSYEETIVKFATKCSVQVLEAAENYLEQLQEAARAKKERRATDIVVSEKTYFALYAILVNYARRMKNRTMEKELIRTYDEYAFEQSHVFYDHLRLLSMLGEVYNQSADERLEMMELAKKNEKQLTKNGGASHALAEAVALVYEIDDVSENPSFQKQRKDWLRIAESAVKRAIADRPGYAKFYCTYARVQCLLGQYENALENIALAVDKEDTTRNDYAIRIGSYESRGQQIRAKMQIEAIEHESRTAMGELEKQSMVKNMEFLGLFSGIVSFTIGSLTISGAIADQSIQSAAGLIVVLMGALMGVFAGFGIILHGWGKGKAVRNLIVLILGLAIVWGGIYICLGLPIPFLNQGMN